MKIPKACASTKYDATAGNLREIRNRLECPAIDAALSANRNRPDRDFDDLFGRLDFNVM